MDVVVNELVVLLLVAVEAEEAEEGITLRRLTGGYGEVAVVPTFSLIPADRFRLPVRNLADDSLRASVVGRWTVRADLRIERGGGGVSAILACRGQCTTRTGGLLTDGLFIPARAVATTGEAATAVAMPGNGCT